MKRHAVLALALAGCAPPPDADTEAAHQSLIGGFLTDARPEVGKVALAGAGCTGTLITDHHVLTAGHCGWDLKAARGGTFTINGNHDVPIKQTLVLGTMNLGTDDLAVAELMIRIPAGEARPAEIAGSTPGNGTTITAMGMGSGRDGRFFGTKQFFTFVRTGNDRLLDRGDSGGPGFIGELGDNGPIGLVHSATQNFGVFSRDLFAEPARFRGDIDAVIDASNEIGVCYRGYIDKIGWLPPACNGALSTGPGSRDDFQAVQIWDTRPGHSVCYEVLANQIGFIRNGCDGQLSGTTGQSRNIQQINFTSTSLPPGVRAFAQAVIAGVGEGQFIEVTNGGAIGTPQRGLRGMRMVIF